MDPFSTLLHEFGLMCYAAIFPENDVELAAPPLRSRPGRLR
jgi:hypothetical protein